MPGGAVRVAVSGAGGRLGSALLAAVGRRPGLELRPWHRPDYDLDDVASPGRLLARDDPELVLHAAAWTDVDGCARDRDLAMRRNADAVDALARACAGRGTRLLLVSSNEVFDGERSDGRGYGEDDPVGPRNPYGASKLAGEQAALAAFGAPAGGAALGAPAGLWIVRTAWLYGAPGVGFPERVVAAADRLPEGDELPMVADEVGSPTLTHDLAEAMLDLVERTRGGTFHLVDTGHASRYEWARVVLARLRPGRGLRPISRQEFVRASDPPPWGVLDASRAAGLGIRLRTWREALDEHLAGLAQDGASAAGGPGAGASGAGAQGLQESGQGRGGGVAHREDG